MSKAKPIDAMMRMSQCVRVNCCRGGPEGMSDTMRSPRSGKTFSFPRSAWERTAVTLCVASLTRQDAERPDVRSHAERGNERLGEQLLDRVAAVEDFYGPTVRRHQVLARVDAQRLVDGTGNISWSDR